MNNITFLISLCVGLFFSLCLILIKYNKVLFSEQKHNFEFGYCIKCCEGILTENKICNPNHKINDLNWKLSIKESKLLLLNTSISTLKNAIKKHRDERGHNRCWESDLELYKVLGKKVDEKEFILPSKEEFLTNCQKYWEDRQPKTEGKFFSAEEVAALRDEYYIKHPDIKSLIDILEKLR